MHGSFMDKMSAIWVKNSYLSLQNTAILVIMQRNHLFTCSVSIVRLRQFQKCLTTQISVTVVNVKIFFWPGMSLKSLSYWLEWLVVLLLVKIPKFMLIRIAVCIWKIPRSTWKYTILAYRRKKMTAKQLKFTWNIQLLIGQSSDPNPQITNNASCKTKPIK